MDNINSKTTLLVAKDIDDSSSKIKKGKALDVKIMAYDAFLKTVKK